MPPGVDGHHIHYVRPILKRDVCQGKQTAGVDRCAGDVDTGFGPPGDRDGQPVDHRPIGGRFDLDPGTVIHTKGPGTLGPIASRISQADGHRVPSCRQILTGNVDQSAGGDHSLSCHIQRAIQCDGRRLSHDRRILSLEVGPHLRAPATCLARGPPGRHHRARRTVDHGSGERLAPVAGFVLTHHLYHGRLTGRHSAQGIGIPRPAHVRP